MASEKSKPFGDFRIVREIASGGQGTVFEAEQMSLRNRRCALKFLTMGANLSDTAVQRFRREAEVVARLGHPNIVPIYARGEEQGQSYFAMKYVDGASLEDVIECLRKRDRVAAQDGDVSSDDVKTVVGPDVEKLLGIKAFLSESKPSSDRSRSDSQLSSEVLAQISHWESDESYFMRVATVLAQVADGLEYAHAQGVIHRDIKPGNIIVGSDGVPVITDFGLATELEGQTLTMTGDVFGTPHYMSPEQITVVKMAIDRRTDVYSLGVTLYELLTLHKPFSGDTREKVYRQILVKEPPHPRRHRREVPTDMATIALKAMEKDPDRRYQTALDMGEDLRRFVRDEPISARPPTLLEKVAKAARRHKAVAATVALGLVVLLMVGVAAHVRVRREWQRAEAKSEELEEQKLVLARRIDDAYWQAHMKFTHRGDPTGQLLTAVSAQEHVRENGIESSRPWGLLARRALAVCPRFAGAVKTGLAWCVTISPDGKTVAAGLDDGGIKLLDLATGREIGVLRGHAGMIEGVSFSPDGRLLASGAVDGKVKLWDVPSRTLKTTLSGHRDKVHRVAFSPDGYTLASAGEDKTIVLWDVDKGAARSTLKGHERGVLGLAYGPGGKALASGSYDNTVRLWDAATGKCEGVLQGHTASVQCVAFAPDGKTIASGCTDHAIRVWDVQTKQQTKMLKGHKSYVRALCFSPRGQTLVSASRDNTIRLWDVAMGQAKATLRDQPVGIDRRVTDVAMTPDGCTIASAGWDGTVKLWDVAPRWDRASVSGHAASIQGARFSPDGRTLASGGEDGKIKLWDVTTRRAVMVLAGHREKVKCVDFSPDGKLLVSGGSDLTVRLWEPGTGRQRAVLRGHRGSIDCVRFSSDGRTIASCGYDKTVRLWDAIDGKVLATLTDHAAWVRCLAFSPDGSLLASGGNDGAIRIWDVASRRQKAALTNHFRYVVSLCFSPEGRLLASGGSDTTVRLWDVARRAEMTELTGHGNWVRGLSFTSDGATLASGSADHTIKLWDVSSYRELATLRGAEQHVISVCFGPNDSLLTSVGSSGVIDFWNPRPLTTLTSDAATRLAGGVLDGFDVRPLHSLGGTPEIAWGDDHPNRWLAGVEERDAEASYRLAVIRETQGNDAEAIALHKRVAAMATDPWTGRSRERLVRIPWLQPWDATFNEIVDELDAKRYAAGVRVLRDAVSLDTGDRQRMVAKLVTHLAGLANAHYGSGDWETAERECEVALELDGSLARVNESISTVQVSIRARRAFEAGDYEAGMDVCRSAVGLGTAGRVAVQQELAERLVKLSRGLWDQKHYGTAERVARFALELRPDYPKALNALGLALVGRDEIANGIAQYRRAIAVNPSYDPARGNLALALELHGEYDEAIGLYRMRLEALRGGVPFGRSIVGKCVRLLRRLGRAEEAVEVGEAWLRKDKKDQSARQELVAALLAVGRAGDAYDDLHPLLKSEGRSARTLLLGVLCAADVGKLDEAAGLLREFMAPRISPGWRRHAIAHVLEAGVDPEAMVMELITGDAAQARAFRLCLGRGYAELASRMAKQKEQKACAAASKEALSLAPGDSRVHYWIAGAVSNLGRYPEALRHFAHAVEIDPDNATVLGSMGWSLYLAGRHDEALDASQRALSLDDQLAFVHANVGLLHAIKGNLAAAMVSYERVIALEPKNLNALAIKDLLDLLEKRPDYTEAHYALAYCYDQAKLRDDCRRHYRAYLESAKEGAFADQARERLKELAAG